MVKNIKRLLACMMIFVMATGVTAYAAATDSSTEDVSKLTAYELYAQVNQLLADIDSYSINTTMSLSMKMLDMPLDMTINGHVSAVAGADGNYELMSEMKSNMFGINATAVSYYSDGVMYVSQDGLKIKMEMPYEDALAQSQTSIGFLEEAVIEQSIVELGSGYALAFSLDGAMFSGMVDGQLDLYGELLDSLAQEGFDYTLSDIEVTVLLDKNYSPVCMYMTFSYDMEVMGVEASADCRAVIMYAQIGGVTIDAPADLDTYIEFEY